MPAPKPLGWRSMATLWRRGFVSSASSALPPIESAAVVSTAMNAVTSAIAKGMITPGEAERIAIVIETFARAISTTKKESSL